MVTNKQTGKHKYMGLAVTTFALGHAYCEGTPSHQKAMEKITNACFLEKDCTSEVLKRQPPPEKPPEPKGCALAVADGQGRNPEVIPHSVKLPVVVKSSAWNCLAGNTANLLHTIGHYDEQMKQMMKLLQNNSSHFYLWEFEQSLDDELPDNQYTKEDGFCCPIDVNEECLPPNVGVTWAQIWSCLL